MLTPQSSIKLHIPAGSSIANQLNHDLIEHLPVGVYLCDEQGVLVAYNRKAAEIWGENPVLGDDQAKFCGAHKLLTPEGVYVPHDQTPLAQILITQKPITNFRAIVERQDGSRVPVLANIIPLHDETGLMVGFMNAVQDQRFQERLEEEKSSLKDALQQSQKMETIGQLTSGLAHDFNNQLSSVVMAFNLMKNEINQEGSEKLKHRFQVAEAAISRATSLVDDLLRFSRHRPRAMCWASPNDLVEAMLDLIQTAIGSSSVINTDLERDVWLIKTNVAQFESSLLNIVLNARDASTACLRLNIATANIAPEDAQPIWKSAAQRASGHVRISISDNGSGMSEEVIQKIFTPFFTTKEPGKGTGLGLAMVKGFVSDMNGRIEVESVEGEGTTIHLYLPCQEFS
jgi:PAS domain S-box-containing protein